MARYQVRANIATVASIALDEEEDYDIVAELKTSRNADNIAKEVFDSYNDNQGYKVYNYTSIDIVDAKSEDLIQRYEFDVNYITRRQAEQVMDEIIDANATPITIFNSEYKASNVLKHTDPYTYEQALNLLVTQANQVIV